MPKRKSVMPNLVYLEKYILDETQSDIILALDNIDRLFFYKETTEIFLKLLSDWHQKCQVKNRWSTVPHAESPKGLASCSISSSGGTPPTLFRASRRTGLALTSSKLKLILTQSTNASISLDLDR